MAAPPSSSGSTVCPIAAFTSAGPARQSWLPSVISILSQSTGKYAPPAMQLPMTAANCGMPAADICGVVAKDAAVVVFVGKDFILQRQEHAGRIDEVNDRQPELRGDLLGSQQFLDRLRKHRAGFDRGVVGRDEARPTADPTDAGDETGGRHVAPLGIHAVSGPDAEFKERAVFVQEGCDPIAGGEAPEPVLPLVSVGAAALREEFPLAGKGRR